MLRCCWLGDRKGIRPVKNWVVRCCRGCLECSADLHMAQLMPLPLTVSCFNKIQIGFTFLVPAHPDSPGHRAIKRVCTCNILIVGSWVVLLISVGCYLQKNAGKNICWKSCIWSYDWYDSSIVRAVWNCDGVWCSWELWICCKYAALDCLCYGLNLIIVAITDTGIDKCKDFFYIRYLGHSIFWFCGFICYCSIWRMKTKQGLPFQNLMDMNWMDWILK